jgi:hypothetical protein
VISQALLWWTRELRTLFWPLFAWSAWVQAATVVAGTAVEGTGLDCVRLNSVGTATHCVGGNDCLGHCSGLCSLGRRGVSQPMWWRARLMRALI